METKRKRWDPIEKLNFPIQWNVNIDGNVCDSVSVCFLATAFIIRLGLCRSVHVFPWLRNICWWCIALWLPELSTTISARSGLSTNFECYVWEQWRDSDEWEGDPWKRMGLVVKTDKKTQTKASKHLQHSEVLLSFMLVARQIAKSMNKKTTTNSHREILKKQKE